MIHALYYTDAALGAASEVDVDLSDEDRAALATEQSVLQPYIAKAEAAEKALRDHDRKSTYRLQARVTIGDAVLDRGVRDEKARMKLELRRSEMPTGADFVFGSDVSKVTDAPLREEPNEVLAAVGRFPQVPDYPNKAESQKNIEDRANTQNTLLDERDAGKVSRASLRAALVRAIANGSDYLWGLEKRLLERFTRRRTYVRTFFYDANPRRRRRRDDEE